MLAFLRNTKRGVVWGVVALAFFVLSVVVMGKPGWFLDALLIEITSTEGGVGIASTGGRFVLALIEAALVGFLVERGVRWRYYNETQPLEKKASNPVVVVVTILVTIAIAVLLVDNMFPNLIKP